MARDKKIFDLWMACYTQEEIGEIVGCVKSTVNEVLNETLFENGKPAKTEQTYDDFLKDKPTAFFNETDEEANEHLTTRNIDRSREAGRSK